MSEQFKFELVSPEKLITSKPVVMVAVPGGEGDYAVLAGHAPLITTVRAGVIEVFTDNDTTCSDRIFVAGGFAEVTNERCTVLAEEAISVASLDRAKLEEESRDLLEDMGLAKTDHARLQIEQKLVVVRAKIQAAA